MTVGAQMGKKQDLGKRFFDVTELVRSIQRAEREPDCFRRMWEDCDRQDCAWRAYCIETEQAVPLEDGRTGGGGGPTGPSMGPGGSSSQPSAKKGE